MGHKTNIFDHIRKMDYGLITYIENGERKQEKGDAEKLEKIYQKIYRKKNMQFVSIELTEKS